MATNPLSRTRKLKADELVRQGKPEEAVEMLRRICASDRSDTEAWFKLGMLERQLQNSEAAEAAFRRVLVLAPRLAIAHCALGSALHAQRKYAEARQSYSAATRIDPKLADAHFLDGLCLQEQGIIEAAATSFERALALQPAHAEALSGLGAVLLLLGDYKGARAALQHCLRLQPGNLEALVNLGTLAEQDGKAEEALATYRRARASHPGDVRLFDAEAALLERMGRLDEASAMLDRVPGQLSPNAVLVRALLAMRRGDYAVAADMLGREVDRAQDAGAGLPLNLLGTLAVTRGQALDRLGETGVAFASLVSGKADLARAAGIDVEADPPYLRQVAKARAWLVPGLAATMPPRQPPGAGSPIFLVGFPRSGTTLLETILDSHPGLQSLDEKPTLPRVVEEFEALAGGNPTALARIDDAQAAHLRAIYERAVDDSCERRPGARIVDKLPLNIIHAHLIRRVFPDAGIILALRHPCDAVLSCLMQNFQLNDAMASFVSLGGAARTYAEVMGLWRDTDAALALAPAVLRYEDLVLDVEGQIRALLEKLGVSWSDAVLDHTAHAQKRGLINTPSYAQVTQPVQTRARYRWLRYRTELEPVLPLLQPCIDAFGYGDAEQA